MLDEKYRSPVSFYWYASGCSRTYRSRWKQDQVRRIEQRSDRQRLDEHLDARVDAVLPHVLAGELTSAVDTLERIKQLLRATD